MASRFASAKNSIAECDRCGFRFKLTQLKTLVIKTKNVNIKVCQTCWEPDHPQLQLGLYPVNDPQAVRDPRPDTSYYTPITGSRLIQWGWNPGNWKGRFCLVRTELGWSDEDARKGLWVEERVVAAVLDPGVSLDANDVAGWVVGDGEPGEGEEPATKDLKSKNRRNRMRMIRTKQPMLVDYPLNEGRDDGYNLLDQAING